MRLRHVTGSEDIVSNSEYCIKKITENATPLKKYFSNENPLELELGMGKGQFIYNKAINYPNINFIGVEKYATVLLKAIERQNIGKLQNLLFLCDDIKNLNLYFDYQSINKIYLNFSDPWPKKRHETRRITHHKFLYIYDKLLKKDGMIEFKTDNIGLFDFSIDEIKKSNFKLINFTYDLHSDTELNKNNIMTEYEQKFTLKGNKICKYIAIKK